MNKALKDEVCPQWNDTFVMLWSESSCMCVVLTPDSAGRGGSVWQHVLAAVGLDSCSCLWILVCISCFQFWIPTRMTALELPC